MGEDTYYGDQSPCYRREKENVVEQNSDQNFEAERESHLEFLNRCAKHYCSATWEEASPEAKVKTLEAIASTHDEEKAYVLTEDEAELMELSKGLGTMRSIMRERIKSEPRFLWSALQENLYTDSRIIIVDKEVSEKLLKKELENYERVTLKFFCEELGLNHSDALKRLNSEITKKRKEASLNILRGDMDKLGELIERLGNEDTVGLKERGFVPSRWVVFSDFGKEWFVRIDGRYYAGLKKEFPKAKFSCNFEGNYPIVGLCEEEELKAIILPSIGSSSSYNNFKEKVREE